MDMLLKNKNTNIDELISIVEKDYPLKIDRSMLVETLQEIKNLREGFDSVVNELMTKTQEINNIIDRYVLGEVK